MQTVAACETTQQRETWMGMATDYDAPRKTDEDTESIQALQERVPDKLSGVVDVEDADNPGSFELAGFPGFETLDQLAHARVQLTQLAPIRGARLRGDVRTLSRHLGLALLQRGDGARITASLGADERRSAECDREHEAGKDSVLQG